MALPLAPTTPCSAIAAATTIHRARLLIMIGPPAGASAAPTARRGRGDVYSTTAAEAAGAAVSQVLLAALAGGRWNGRERGDGQGQGENNLRHRSSPLGFLFCSGGSAPWPTASSPVRGRVEAPAPGARFSRGSERRLSPDVWFALNFLGDSLEISQPLPGMG